jgi:outer membrane protein OmpA-like peptidoglycan-associated protein
MKYTVQLFIIFFFTGTTLVYAQKNQKILKDTAVKRKPPLISTAYYKDTTLVLIPFDYKQSALYLPHTYEVIDSVATMLLKKNDVTLSIDGYAHPDEGNDTICKYLALNRALFVRDYVLGRGIDSSRIILVRGLSKTKSVNSDIDKDGHTRNCKAELRLNFPIPPEILRKADRDEDGVVDIEDNCPDDYGYKENNGCKDSNTIVIPFENQQSSLSPFTYRALDSVVTVLKENAAYTVAIEGHAYKSEGIAAVCQRLSMERASIVKNYLLSRNISNKRIVTIKSAGINRPYNAGKNPREIAANYRAEILLKK